MSRSATRALGTALATLAAGFLAAFAPTANAAVVNGGFEGCQTNNVIISGGLNVIGGWTTANDGVEWFPGGLSGLGPGKVGNCIVDLAWYTNTDPIGGAIWQDVATVAGQSYDLSFYGLTAQFAGRDGTGEIEVWVDGTLRNIFNVVNHSATWVAGDWVAFTQGFSATGATTRIEFRNNQNAFEHFALIDGVSVQAQAVPEPGVLALLGLAVFGFAGTRRRA